MGSFNSSQLGNLQVANQTSPAEGPRCIPLGLNFETATPGATVSIPIDLSVQQYQTRISMVQTLFLDLSQTDSPVSVKVEGTNQVLIAKGRTQGYYPCLAPAPTRFTFSSAANAIIQAVMINVPIAGAVWATQ